MPALDIRAYLLNVVSYLSRDSYPFGHILHGLDTGPVQIIVVLARLDELVLLDVLLHLFSGHHKVVVSPVHLVVPLWPSGIFGAETARSSFLLKLQVYIYKIHL